MQLEHGVRRGGGGGGGGWLPTKRLAGRDVEPTARACPLKLSNIPALEVHGKVEVALEPAIPILMDIHHPVAGPQLAQNLHIAAANRLKNCHAIHRDCMNESPAALVMIFHS